MTEWYLRSIGQSCFSESSKFDTLRIGGSSTAVTATTDANLELQSGGTWIAHFCSMANQPTQTLETLLQRGLQFANERPLTAFAAAVGIGLAGPSLLVRALRSSSARRAMFAGGISLIRRRLAH